VVRVIRPGLAEGATLDGFRALYRGARPPFALLPDALEPAAAAELRARVDAGLEPFYLADRGRYQINRTIADAPLYQRLRQIAARVVEAPLTVGAAHWLRFGHGDYSLLGSDRGAGERRRQLELTCDFSSASTDQAQIVYLDGAQSLVVPQWAGSLVLVDKPPTMRRYERYLTHAVGTQAVYRLRLLLDYA
jgi:hypothetical protein